MSLEAQVQDRARKMAEKRLRLLSHNMALENQRVSEEDEQAQLERMIEEVLKAPPVKRKAGEPVFHEDCERRVFAMNLAALALERPPYL